MRSSVELLMVLGSPLVFGCREEVPPAAGGLRGEREDETVVVVYVNGTVGGLGYS